MDNHSPPCEGCQSGDVPLLPENEDAVRVWSLLNAHARNPASLDGSHGSLRLESMRAECDRTADPEGLFQKILLLETIFRPQPQPAS